MQTKMKVGELMEGDFIETDDFHGCIVWLKTYCRRGVAYAEIQERPEQEDGFSYVRIEDGRFRFV